MGFLKVPRIYLIVPKIGALLVTFFSAEAVRGRSYRQRSVVHSFVHELRHRAEARGIQGDAVSAHLAHFFSGRTALFDCL